MKIIRTLFRLSLHFSKHLDILQIIQILFRSTKHIPDYNISTLWMLSGPFADNQEMFFAIWLLLRPFGYFLDHSKIISKYSRHSGGRPAKTLRHCKNFSVSIIIIFYPIVSIIWPWSEKVSNIWRSCAYNKSSLGSIEKWVKCEGQNLWLFVWGALWLVTASCNCNL